MSFEVIWSRISTASSKWLRLELKGSSQKPIFLVSSTSWQKSPYSFCLLHNRDTSLSENRSSICKIFTRSVSTTSAYERGRNRHKSKRQQHSRKTVSTTLPFPAPAHRITKPSLEIANTMPLSIEEMDNTSLVTLGSLGNHSARVEILKRHIMAADQIGYDEATIKFHEIARKNDDIVWLISLPYRLGVVTSLFAGAASIPLVFDLSVAHWFNHHFVTTDIPEPQHVETFFEVGS
jgi:hypothetical protein